MFSKIAKLSGNIGEKVLVTLFSCIGRKHEMFLPNCSNIFCFSEATFVERSNILHVGKLGSIEVAALIPLSCTRNTNTRSR